MFPRKHAYISPIFVDNCAIGKRSALELQLEANYGPTYTCTRVVLKVRGHRQ